MNNNSLLPGLSSKSKQTYEKILTVARTQFSKTGYENTTIQIIAKKSKVSVGCIYKYFQSKEELYRIIITNEQKKVKNFINQHITFCESRIDKEIEGLRAWLLYVDQNPNVYKLIWETLFFDKDLFDEYYNNFASVYAKALEKNKDEISNTNYLVDAFMLIGISNFLGVKLITSSYNKKDIDTIVEAFSEIYKNGFLKK